MKAIFFQGREGAYSHEAAFVVKTKIKNKGQIIPCKDFNQLFTETLKNDGLGVVPIENSTAGSVAENIDNFFKFKIKILGEIILPIKHQLFGLKNATLKDIKNVYSHYQAINQSKRFLTKNKLNFEDYFDTAGAVEMIAKKEDITLGAIGSIACQNYYPVKIISKNIQDQNNNQTRFLVIGKINEKDIFIKDKKIKSLKTTLIFETKNIPSALYKCLGAFATNGFNLTKIESRPIPENNFKYRFFLEVEGSSDSKHFASALKEIRFFTENLKVLGTYCAI